MVWLFVDVLYCKVLLFIDLPQDRQGLNCRSVLINSVTHLHWYKLVWTEHWRLLIVGWS